MRSSKLRKPSDSSAEEILLRDYGLNLKYRASLRRQETDPDALRTIDPFSTVNCMGALTAEDIRFVRNNCQMTVGRLGLLMECYLQLQYLLTPVKQGAGIDELADCEQVRVGELLRVLLRGDFYRYLRECIPKCIINNRTTSTNVEIVMAAILLVSINKLTMEEVKEALVIFTLQERENEIDGVFLEASLIMGMLKHLNRTMSHQSLRQWLAKQSFRMSNFLMPWEFLYLVAQCPYRQPYLRKICKLNFKSVKMPNSKLYLIQPAKQIAGTPDYKIQQQLAALEAQEQPKSVKNQTMYRFAMAANKTCKSVSKFREMLRQDSIYKDIKSCLAGKEKTQNLKECLLEVKPRIARLKRPQSSVPILTEVSFLGGKSIGDKADRLKTMHTTADDQTQSKHYSRKRPVTSLAHCRSTPLAKPSTGKRSNFRNFYQQQLSAFDLHKHSKMVDGFELMM